MAQYFYRIADKFEDQKAIIFVDQQSITYGELNGLSNKIARCLVQSGVRPHDVICIFNNKTKFGYAAMLACLKIGAIYTNLDSENPNARLKKIFETCRPKIVVSDLSENERIYRLCEEKNIPFMDLCSAEAADKIDAFESHNLPESDAVTGSDPAYIMFTSGSTGLPKGVLISHGNLLSFIQWSIDRFNVTEIDVLTNLNPIYFDNSVFDFYTALFSGASLAAIPKRLMNDPAKIVQTVEMLGCTIWFSVPSLLIFLMTMRVIDQKMLRKVRIFAFGGEGYPKTELKRLFDRVGSFSRLVNVYGPTECTCICTAYDIDNNTFLNYDDLPLLGPINPNFNYLILDDQNQKVAGGKTGELCLLGPNVGLGYYNDIERTATAFVANPINNEFQEKMYKTGDLVREVSVDGLRCLAFKGRKDNQIKHLGYRIELEEIETAINKHPKVIQSAVVYHRINDKYGDIIAYFASKDKLATSDIEHYLRDEIPDYMFPTKYILLDRLPWNQNGKVDRNKLRQMA
jgi:D-alanine--poly(phosphoribitol) ligase subunit 1